MDRAIRRTLALCFFIVTLLGGAWASRAQTASGPAVDTPRGLRRGRSAIQALGTFLPQVALRHGYTPERLRNLLLRDPDLAVDGSGALLYTCSFPPPPPAPRAEAIPEVAPVTALATTFQLHSRPGSQRKIYLDFDGHTTEGTQWNVSYNSNQPILSPAFSLDVDTGTFSSAELAAIQTAWVRVAEDYAPFDVDVTTEDPGLEAIHRSSAADQAYGVRVVITHGASWYPTGGGVGFVGTFDAVLPGNDWPCFVFYDRLASTARYIAEAASHEAGHTLGLNHDGLTNGTAYYEGQGDWAPIMGVGYYRNVTQWSKGEYPLANNTEDDLALIQQHGALMLTDDHGNTTNTATTFDLSTGSATGVITSKLDQDVFKLVVPAARTLRLKASTLALADGANLDLSLHLYDSQGNHLAGQDSDATLDASLSTNVAAGTYYAVVAGSGNGNVATTGYTNYGSIGTYTLALTDAPFNLTSPNGGEVWTAGSSQTITWTTSVSGNVKLEYSTDSGATWTSITTSTANDGSQTWTVPNAVTSQARVQVSLAADPTSSDTSDADFTIQAQQPSTLTLTAPNGGETWTVGSQQAITWTSSNVTGNVKLEYSTNAGSSWTTISASTANDGFENWTVPNAVTTQARVRVTWLTNTAVKDTSDANFTIQAVPGVITVTAPNGGESWTEGTTHAITWTSSNVSGNVKLEYSTNGGSSWTTISASSANDGAENWLVPAADTSQARVRVSSVNDGSATDTSDANFTLVPLPTLTLTAPNGGESWTAGTQQSLTWTSSSVSGNVKLEYSTDAGSTWNPISASTANDGIESWTVPDLPTTQARVRVSSVATPSVSDASNANFTILALPKSVSVTAPNGGESWTVGTTHAITWTSSNVSGNVKLEYSTNGGSSWTTISASTANDGAENWLVPDAPTTQARVRVSSIAEPGVADVSDANFTLAGAPVLTVTSPNGGELWSVGSLKTITWTSANLTGNVKLEYSTDAGTTWTPITLNTANDGTEPWTVPNAVTTQARVRVTSLVDGSVADTSDANVTIQSAPLPSLLVTSPNGGESWDSGSSHAITWVSSNVSGSVKLEYSLDGGATWTVIADNLANDGTESWTLPAAGSAQARVRVSAVDGSTNDTSDADFTVRYVGGKLKAPKKVSFGTIKLVKPKTVKVVLENTDKKANLEVNVSISGAPFRIVSGGGASTILPKKKLTVLVIFEPTAAGTATGSLFVASSDSLKTSLTIPLTGKAK